MRMPCICNGLATHVPAILLQTKDRRILPPKLSLFSYVYPGVTVREHTGASDHGTGQTLPYGNTKARAYGTRLRVCAPALWKGGQNRGISPGESAGGIPWPVRRPSLCLRLWNPIVVRSRPRLTHRNVHGRTQTRAMTRGDRGVQSTGVAWQSLCIRPGCSAQHSQRPATHSPCVRLAGTKL